MIITLPENFCIDNSLNFCLSMDSYINKKEYTYNCKDVSTIEPFGMLLIGAKIREFKFKNLESEHTFINTSHLNYAKNMGFFDSLSESYNSNLLRAKGNNNYIPITRLNLRSSYQQAFNEDISIDKYLENESMRLATVLSRGNNKNIEVLKYCIMEIIRNVYDHSNSENLWYAGQFWPTKNMVEIAILDEGKGIKESFKLKKSIVFDSNISAIKKALMPGVTRTSTKKRAYDLGANVGYGLYMTSNICDKYGSFAICSGDTCLMMKNGKTNIMNTNFKGTAIRMRLNTSKNLNLNELLRSLREEGRTREMIAGGKI